MRFCGERERETERELNHLKSIRPNLMLNVKINRLQKSLSGDGFFLFSEIKDTAKIISTIIVLFVGL